MQILQSCLKVNKPIFQHHTFQVFAVDFIFLVNKSLKQMCSLVETKEKTQQQ